MNFDKSIDCNNQKSMPINIYEGENNFVKYNNLLKNEVLRDEKKEKEKVKMRVIL